MSVLARSTRLVRQPALRSSPFAQKRLSHGPYSAEDAVPFSFKSRSSMAAKTGIYLAIGFATPFIAAVYQLKKAGA